MLIKEAKLTGKARSKPPAPHESKNVSAAIGGATVRNESRQNSKPFRFTVRKVMKREGLRAIAPKRFIPPTTDSKHGLPIAANLLQNGANTPTSKGAVVVGDITYLRLADGKFCYLATLQDKFTRRIVDWKVAMRIRQPICGG